MNRALIPTILLTCVSTPALAATITVNTTADELNSNGNCSLREAISAANSDSPVDGCTAGNGADVIVIPAGTYVLTLTGADEDGNATGDLDITAPVTLQGDSASTTIIDGNGTDRVLQVIGANVAVTLTKLTVRNGKVPDAVSPGDELRGGGILSAGPLTLTDVTFSGNTAGTGLSYTGLATAGGNGGGVYAGGALTVTGCRFYANTAGAGGSLTGPTPPGSRPGFGGNGGAIGGSGTWIIARSTFELNGSGAAGTSSGGGPSAESGEGGAVWLDSGTLSVDASTFRSNSSADNHGGALALNGSAVVTRSTFTGNLGELGGAIAALANSATSRIVSSTFVGNVSSLRGAVCSADSNAVDVYGSTFAYNVGTGVAVELGGSVALRNSVVVGNRDVSDAVDEDCENANGSGTISSNGYNVIGPGCIAAAQTGDQLLPAGSGPVVVSDTLTDLGGPTQVLPLPAGSPAIGTGTCTDDTGATVELDQRGGARAAPCDVGAVQMNATPGTARMNVTAEPAGANCPYGGERIDVGIDTNGDGVLEASEVTSTEYICNGAPGAAGQTGQTGPSGANGQPGAAGANGKDGATALVSTTAVASGDGHCASGGTRIDVGVDSNGNGVLEASEVQSTAYVCNGTNGANGANGATGPSGGCGSGPGPAGAGLIAELFLGAAVLLRRRRP